MASSASRLAGCNRLVRSRRRIGAALRPEPRLAYDRLSDPILVRRAKDGDARALEALCERHAPRVGRLAGHVLGDPEDASDAAQEALAKLCVKLGQFRGEAAFSTWLHRLTLNACRDVARPARGATARAARGGRARPRRARRPIARPSSRSSGPTSATASPALPAAQARVLVLKDALGFSFEEISAASGMPVGTAKCYAHRAARRCANCSRQELPHDPAAPFGKDVIESILPAPRPVPAARRGDRARAGQEGRRDAGSCARTTGGSPVTSRSGPSCPAC